MKKSEEVYDFQNSIEAPPLVFVVVLNWNGWRDTIDCINSLEGVTYSNFRILICDNNSTDDSIHKIREWTSIKGIRIISDMVYSKFVLTQSDSVGIDPAGIPDGGSGAATANKNIIIIRNTENSGFSGGNNIAIRYALSAGAQYVLVLNNDVVVEPDFLSEMLRTAIVERADMIAPVVVEYASPDVVDRIGITLTRSGLGYNRKHNDDGPFFCPSGCAALYSKALLSGIECSGEYFDEDFFAYYEDLDLGFRARLRGFNAAVAVNAVVRHKGGQAFGGTGSQKQYYLRHRNTIWFIVKNYTVSLLLGSLPSILLAQLLGLMRNIGANFTPVLKGKLDGIKGVGKMLRKRRTIQEKSGSIDKHLFDRKLFHAVR
jgi:GT2 family glycosyltransferase